MKIYFISLFLVMLVMGCLPEKERSIEPLYILPKPQQMDLGQGTFRLDHSTTFFCDSEFTNAEEYLRNYLYAGAGISLPSISYDKAAISIEKDTSLPKEGYNLVVTADQILIRAADSGGAFYGVQTLRQVMPISLEEKSRKIKRSVDVPQLTISDVPAFSYRGMHLDAARHFFSKEFIKKYIANMAMLKMNYFHWHLTDDQGWRIEIKKYPKLITHAAFRDETLIGHFNETPQKFDKTRYGGYYSQEDIVEIVAFANKHNVTVIPEIEMPGHAQATISAYPELGCTGEAVPVATKWGVFETIFCPNERTFTFLKDVLDEVILLFPGEYIHIGGDEAPKVQWQNCAHCQKLIVELNLKDEHGLQSYFIKTIESFINSKGKKIIGWDEILEGGLPPNATVMSWRGIQGGIDAALQKHQVIMTPTSHAYFDYYQSDHADEPLAIGGFTPLKKVFGFNPIPNELNKEEATYIIGAQGNVWTEYIQTEEKVEYMAFPRMIAMSEVVWSGVTEDLENDYSDFLIRLEPFLERLNALHTSYANHIFDLEGNVKKQDGTLFFELTTPTKDKEIRYSINESEYTTYATPIPISENSTIKATVFKNGKKIGREFMENIIFHKGIKTQVILNTPPHPTYSSGGKEALINGIKGSDNRYGDKEWLGFWGDNVEITLNFLEETEISDISLRFYNANGQWIYAPNQVEIFVQQTDGKWTSTLANIDTNRDDTIIPLRFSFKQQKTKLIKISIPNFGVIPSGFQGAGNNAWTFIDEIEIN